MRLDQLFETASVSIDDIFSPEEQQQLVAAVKSGQGDVGRWEMEARRRLQNMGLNPTLHISPILKWIHQVDKKFNPEKFRTPDTSGAWDDYGKARARGDEDVVGMGPGGRRTWTGD
jgi:hypothetical protein